MIALTPFDTPQDVRDARGRIVKLEQRIRENMATARAHRRRGKPELAYLVSRVVRQARRANAEARFLARKLRAE